MKQHEHTIILDPDIEGRGYTVLVRALPGCITEGDTRDEAISNAKEAILLHLESMLTDGELVPPDVSDLQILKVAV